MGYAKEPSNEVIVDGFPCKVIGGRHLMRYDHAASYRGCADKTISNEVWAGKLKGYRLGRYGYVDKHELDRRVLGDSALMASGH